MFSLTAFLPSPLSAQGTSTGTITGAVLDQSGGKFLEGAEVSVEGTGIRAVTERGGRFTLRDVPEGARNVVVRYPGLDDQSRPVTVVAGETADAEIIRLSEQVIELEEYHVSATREGMAQAQALQKVSIQSKLVAASDQFGEVSEGNVGEYLKFLPGVSIDYNANDARGISLRGLSTTYTVVAVDGTPMAATSSMDDTRRFEFEQIAMNNVETTELYKTVTPDIPANATGGYVNFVTKSAFDTERPSVFSYNVSLTVPTTRLEFGKEGGVWGRGEQYVLRPSAELNYSRRLSDKLGINFNYRLSEIYHDSPRTIYTWVNDIVADANGTTLTNPRLQSFTIKDEQKMTHREAFAAKVDFRPSDATKFVFAGQWNWYDLMFQQRGPTFTLGTGSTRTGNTFTSGTAGRAINNNVLQRNKYGTTWHLNSGFSHDFANGSRLAGSVYWSRADGKYRDASQGFTQAGVNLPTTAWTAFTLDDPITQRIPGISIVNGAASVPLDYIRNLANYTFTGGGGDFQSRPWTALDNKRGFNADYTIDFPNIRIPFKLQTGIAVDNVERDIDRITVQGTISPAVSGTALAGYDDADYRRDVAYGFGLYQVPDIYALHDNFGGRLTALSSYLVREFTEDNTALFARADAQINDDLLLIGGFRYEKRKIEASATNRASSRALLGEVALDYDNLYPSLSFRYAPAAHRNIIVRGGFSRTVGHPDYAYLVPSINDESAPGLGDGQISVPAPGVQPYYSNNYDLSLDYYLGDSGVFGIYAYRKEVDNPIIQRGVSATEAKALATAWGYDPNDFNSGTISENFGSSTIHGVELSYTQQFRFLPKPFDGLNLQANLTIVDVNSSDYETDYSQLRAVAPKTFNLVLGYRYRGFTFTSTTNWTDDVLFGGFVASSFFVGSGDSRLALYRAGKAVTDLKFEYSFNEKLSAYLLVRNITNEGRLDYARTYVPGQPKVNLPFSDFEFGDPFLTLGFRGRF